MRIISRTAWGALPGAQVEHRPWPEGGPLVVHHTVSPAPPVDASWAVEAAIMRGFDRHHFYGNGWRGGIGYSYVVMPSGRVHEGRGRDTVGAHSPGANHLPGVAMVGDYRDARPTGEALAALGALAHHLGALELRGHRDYHATSCPGAVLYGMLGWIPLGPAEDPPPPGDATLRLMVRRRSPDGARLPDLFAAGWARAEGPLRWIAAHGLQPVEAGRPDHWIAWQGGRWYGARDVTNVARRLVRDHLEAS